MIVPFPAPFFDPFDQLRIALPFEALRSPQALEERNSKGDNLRRYGTPLFSLPKNRHNGDLLFSNKLGHLRDVVRTCFG